MFQIGSLLSLLASSGMQWVLLLVSRSVVLSRLSVATCFCVRCADNCFSKGSASNSWSQSRKNEKTAAKQLRKAEKNSVGVGRGGKRRHEPEVAQTPEAAWARQSGFIEEDSGGKIVLLGEAFSEHTMPSKITRGYVYRLPHLLLPAGVEQVAMRMKDHVRAAIARYGDEDAKVWQQLSTPLQHASKQLAGGGVQACFGGLLGIQLALLDEGAWVDYHPAEYSAMATWFTAYGAAWRTLLKRSDQALGLSLPGGIKFGYRPALCAMLTQWEDATNVQLKNFDEFVGDDKARVHICTKGSDDANPSDEDGNEGDDNDGEGDEGSEACEGDESDQEGIEDELCAGGEEGSTDSGAKPPRKEDKRKKRKA